MAKIKVGQVAPSVILESVDGKKVSIADYLQEWDHTLLIFLRHLA